MDQIIETCNGHGPLATQQNPELVKLEIAREIWEEVLEITGIPDGANFFSIGGHSLLGGEVCHHVKKLTGLKLGLKDLIKNPTLKEFASLLPDEGEVIIDGAPELKDHSHLDQAPLGTHQKQAWYLEIVNPGSNMHNLPYGIRIRAAIDPTRLHDAFLKVLENHPALRMTIVDGPAQKHNEMDEVRKHFYIQYMEPPSIEAAKRDMEMVSREVLDTSLPPVLAVKLYRLSNDDHILLVVFHHMFFDGWSFEVFVDSLSRAYDGKELKKEENSFVDFSLWQQDYLQSSEFAGDRKYWEKKLKNGLPVLEMPTDHARAPMIKYEGAVESFRINSEVLSKLREKSKEIGVSLFTLFLGCYKKMLLDYTKQDEVVVGVPVRGRPSESLINTIGCFANALPLKTSGVDDLQKFFLGIQDEFAETLGHQEMPHSEMLSFGSIQRDSSRSPLYQNHFSFQDFQTKFNLFGDDKYEVMYVDRGSIYTDFDCYVIPGPDGVELILEYRKDLFTPKSVQRLGKYYLDLLNFVTINMSTRWSDFRSPSFERDLSEINRGYVLEAPDASLIEKIKNVARENKNRSSIVFQGQTISYGELIEKAQSYAWHLKGEGVEQGDLVGLSCQRSPEMIASMLGVMMIGAGYVPLDPYFPPERLRFMIEETGCKKILCDNLGRSRLSEKSSEFIDMDDIDWDKKQLSSSEFDLDNVMYIIFTSGSTGRPKGVQTTYRNAMNFLLGMQSEPGIKKDHVVLAHTTMCFDISILEIFLPLMSCAKIVLAEKNDSIDGKALKILVETNGVNYIQATPSTWRLLLGAGFEPTNSLVALCGAEPFPLDLARELVPKCESVWNMYGPTETTVWCSCHRITEAKPPFLVGRPIENATFYILDSNLNPVPMGAIGELYIGGAGVSRGFSNREELTKSLFIPDPFRGEGLMYRSGDLARFNGDGILECMGRGDGQVKVRGHRIELGEIEYVLQEHEEVLQAVVSLREDRPGDQRLVGYVKLSDKNASIKEIKKFLGAKLPSYMVPAHIIVMDSFPLTLSSKVDRKSLPSPLEIDTGKAIDTQSSKQIRQIQKREMKKVLAPGLVSIKPFGEKTPIVCFSDFKGDLKNYVTLGSNVEDHPVFGINIEDLESRGLPLGTLDEHVPYLVQVIKEALPDGPYIFLGQGETVLLADKCAKVFTKFGCDVKTVQLLNNETGVSSGAIKEVKQTIKHLSLKWRLMLFKRFGLSMPNNLKDQYLDGLFKSAVQREAGADLSAVIKLSMDRTSFLKGWELSINE